MISIDGSLFIQIVNFIFLIWVLNVVLYKPIRKILAQRKEKVNGLGQSIDACVSDAREKEDALSMGIKEARARGLQEKDALTAEAAEEEKRIVAAINENARAELVRVREKIAKDAESVMLSLQKEVDTFAKAIVQKILGRAV